MQYSTNQYHCTINNARQINTKTTIGRRLHTSLRVAATAIIVAVLAISHTDARLRGGGVQTQSQLRATPQQEQQQQHQQEQQRALTEMEETAKFMKLAEEYHAEEEARKQAMDEAMAAHNAVMSDEDIAAESQKLQSILHEEEQHHQERATKNEEEEEQERIENAKIAEKKEAQKIKYYLHQEKCMKKQEEKKTYEALLKIKQDDKERDTALMRDVHTLMESQQQALEDKIVAQQDDTYEHHNKFSMHGNTNARHAAVVRDEQAIADLHTKEMELQHKHHQQQLARDQRLLNEYIQTMQQNEEQKQTASELTMVGR